MADVEIKRGRAYAFFRWSVILLPAFLFLCALVLPFLPGTFSDSAKPWYHDLTAPLLLAALFYSYPVTFLCTRLVSDDMFFSPGFFLVLAVYSAIWALLLRSIFRFCETRARNRG